MVHLADLPDYDCNTQQIPAGICHAALQAKLSLRAALLGMSNSASVEACCLLTGSHGGCAGWRDAHQLPGAGAAQCRAYGAACVDSQPCLQPDCVCHPHTQGAFVTLKVLLPIVATATRCQVLWLILQYRSSPCVTFWADQLPPPPLYTGIHVNWIYKDLCKSVVL